MPKAYWIARLDVHNDEPFEPYSLANDAIFEKFGARFIVRSGKQEVPEGAARSRSVVVEFPDYATAVACYRSPEYQANLQLRLPHSTVDLVIVEGCGPPP